jgi:hypothetical protein
MAGETRVYGWESTAKAVISFIEAPDVEAAALHELVAVRRRRAEQRAKSLASLDRVLSGCARATAALPDLLSHVALALAGGPRGTGSPKKKGKRAAAAASALVHYSHDLAVRCSHCSPPPPGIVCTSWALPNARRACVLCTANR